MEIKVQNCWYFLPPRFLQQFCLSTASRIAKGNLWNAGFNPVFDLVAPVPGLLNDVGNSHCMKKICRVFTSSGLETANMWIHWSGKTAYCWFVHISIWGSPVVLYPQSFGFFSAGTPTRLRGQWLGHGCDSSSANIRQRSATLCGVTTRKSGYLGWIWMFPKIGVFPPNHQF